MATREFKANRETTFRSAVLAITLPSLCGSGWVISSKHGRGERIYDGKTLLGLKIRSFEVSGKR